MASPESPQPTAEPMFARFFSRRSRRGPAAAPGRGSRRIECLEQRRMLSGLPLGAMPQDTGEFLLGRVAVTPVLLESTGEVDPNTQDWTAFEIQGVLQKVHEAMQWWTDTLDSLQTVHSLEFVYDESFARQPYQTPYEPIDRSADAYQLYVSAFLTDAGYRSGTLEDQMRSFNHSQRLAMNADWAFTIFMVDSSDDGDGAFPSGSHTQAFAFAGGLFMITPSTRPASTIAHETGHLFWARDEYSHGGSWTDRRGYYNTQNLNAADNPTPGFEQQISIMSSGTLLAQAYTQRVSPDSTLAMVGWQDSDGDGIFDVADVPLQLIGSGAVDAAGGRFSFEGFASAVALPNRNPSGLQNDITLNRISRIEYRIDGGAWLTAASPDLQATPVSLSLQVPDNLQSIQLRAVDDAVGVVSPTITATPLQPAAAAATLAGFAFVDLDHDGVRRADESLLPDLAARIVAFQGAAPPRVEVDPDDYSSGPLPADLAGVTLTAQGATVDGRVGVQSSSMPDAGAIFAYFDLQTSQWRTGWSQRDALEATLDSPATEVHLNAVGRQAGSIGRLEAYDSQGRLLHRVTSSPLAVGQVETLKVTDAQGRIASVRALGHARTTVALDQLRIGPQLTSQSDAFGVLRFENLPDGAYDLQLTSRLAIHQVPPVVQVTVADGQAAPLQIAAKRVPSPWRNATDPADVDDNGRVEPLDALRVINELNRSGGGALQNPSAITTYYDTSDDGLVTALDALLVINILNRRSSAADVAAAEGEPQPQAWYASAAEGPSDGGVRQLSSDADAAGALTNAAAVDHLMAAWPMPAERSFVSSAQPEWTGRGAPPDAAGQAVADHGGTTAADGQQKRLPQHNRQASIADHPQGLTKSAAEVQGDGASFGDGSDRTASLLNNAVVPQNPFFPEPLVAEGFKDGGAWVDC